jgi:hypothetical protein
MATTVIVPWYATGFRADAFELALNEVARVALRYGASSYTVYRSREDRYRFQQLAGFDDQLEWDRYWTGPEMVEFRARHSGWFQVPVVYAKWDATAGGTLLLETAAGGNGQGNRQGRGNPHGVHAGESG